MLDCYLGKTYREFHKGKFAVADCRSCSRLQCFAECLAFYYLLSKSKPELQNNSPTVVLDNEPMKTNHLLFSFYLFLHEGESKYSLV